MSELLKEQEATIKEKERALKELDELHKAELEQAERDIGSLEERIRTGKKTLV